MNGINFQRRAACLLPGLLALVLTAPAAAQLGSGRLRADCTATSSGVQALAGPACQPVAVNAMNAGFLELSGSTHAVLFPTADCSGPSVGVLTSAPLCGGLAFSNGKAVRGSVKSLFLWPGPNPAFLSGTYRSAKGRILRLSVQPDGRITGSLTAAWETSKRTVTVPIFSGVARWMTLGTNVPVDQGQATNNWGLSLQLCAGLFTPGFQDATTCVSYTGAGQMALGTTTVPSLTLQRAEMRGLDNRGFQVAGELEAFLRVP